MPTPEERARDVLATFANRPGWRWAYTHHDAIAEVIRAAVAEEREACAKLCEIRLAVAGRRTGDAALMVVAGTPNAIRARANFSDQRRSDYEDENEAESS